MYDLLPIQRTDHHDDEIYSAKRGIVSVISELGSPCTYNQKKEYSMLWSVRVFQSCRGFVCFEVCDYNYHYYCYYVCQ